MHAMDSYIFVQSILVPIVSTCQALKPDVTTYNFEICFYISDKYRNRTFTPCGKKDWNMKGFLPRTHLQYSFSLLSGSIIMKEWFCRYGTGPPLWSGISICKPLQFFLDKRGKYNKQFSFLYFFEFVFEFLFCIVNKWIKTSLFENNECVYL